MELKEDSLKESSQPWHQSSWFHPSSLVCAFEYVTLVSVSSFVLQDRVEMPAACVFLKAIRGINWNEIMPVKVLCKYQRGILFYCQQQQQRRLFLQAM